MNVSMNFIAVLLVSGWPRREYLEPSIGGSDKASVVVLWGLRWVGFGSETIRKPQVAGSIPVAGSKRTNRTRDLGVLKRVCPLHGDRTRGLAPFVRASERLCELARELGSIPVAGSTLFREI